MNKTRNIAIARLSKDIKEILKEPQNGIGISIYQNNPLKYIVNMKLLNGIYSGLYLQLILSFPDTYPINPPEISLIPNQGFDNKYHHHIYNNNFCFDLLANRYLSVKDKQTGWTSCYTLSSLLLQVQIFLSDPDFPDGHTPPSKEDIAKLFKMQKEYQITFKGNDNETITHTWENPYPQMHEVDLAKSNNGKSSDIDTITKIEKDTEVITSNKPTIFYDEETELKESLTCSVLKTNYIEDPDTTLGYPIIRCDNSFYPIPEMLSYEAYVNHIQNEEQKLDHYFNVKYKSSMGNFYNCWFPIYINKAHFEKNKETILNALTVIVHGASGIKKYDFNPQYIINVFPRLLNTMLLGLFQNNNVISEAFLCCYFHFVLLFKKLMEMYDKDVNVNEYVISAKKKIEHIKTLNNNMKQSYSIHYEDYLILLLFSSKERREDIEQLFLISIIKDNIKHVIEKDSQAKQKLIDILINQKALLYFDLNDDIHLDDSLLCTNEFKHWSELYEILKDDYHLKSTFKMNKGNELGFLSKTIANDPNIVQVDLYDDFDFFAAAKEEEANNDEPIEYTDYTDYADLYNEIKEKFMADQHKTFALCTRERKQRVFTLLQNNYTMSNYIKDFNKEEARASISTLAIKRLLEQCNECSRQQFVNYVYSQNSNNQIMFILYITRQYFSDKGFMQTLEKNYGVLLQDQLYKVKHELQEANESILNYGNLLKKINCASYLPNEFELYQEIYIKSDF